MDTAISNTTDLVVIGIIVTLSGSYGTNNPSNFVYDLNGGYYFANTGNDSSLTGNVYGVYGYGQAYRETGNSYCYGLHFLSYAGGNETYY